MIPWAKKMSKSKGNVVDPLELVEQYGADAVRFALVYGNATGNDQSLSYPKLDAARKFTNKLWNMGRFLEMMRIRDYAKINSTLLDLDELVQLTVDPQSKKANRGSSKGESGNYHIFK